MLGTALEGGRISRSTRVFLSPRKAAKLGVRRAMRRSSPPGRYAGLLMSGCQDTEYSYDAYFQGRVRHYNRAGGMGNYSVKVRRV